MGGCCQSRDPQTEPRTSDTLIGRRSRKSSSPIKRSTVRAHLIKPNHPKNQEIKRIWEEVNHFFQIYDTGKKGYLNNADLVAILKSAAQRHKHPMSKNDLYYAAEDAIIDLSTVQHSKIIKHDLFHFIKGQ